MIEQCFTVNRVIEFPFQPKRAAETSGDFAGQGVARAMALTMPNGTPVNFTWLDFIPGRITEAQLTSDVLTGPMSGCWLTVYRRAGQRHVGHVGTDSNNPLATTNVKSKWGSFVGGNYREILGGFKPSADIGAMPPASLPPAGNDGQFFIFGAVTSQMRFFCIFSYIQGRGWAGQNPTDKIRIAKVHEVAVSTLPFPSFNIP